ncbi:MULTISPECIES: hypothetical protein [Mumia]|uniref:Uncharacterized protein n=1 Tax=Mumia xiangluensis TaxID=1678900 RepID=A0ABW1QHY6_9ACTN|nr:MULTISPECIES: hypothetical protein [Mumia]
MAARDDLTVRLYGFNRLPLSPKIRAAVPGERDLRGFVLAGTPGLSEHWRSRRLERRAGWLSWIRRDGTSRTPTVAHKLYISPMPEAVGDAVRVLTPLVTDSPCVAFKLGATPSFLARPDKLVAYFRGRNEMLDVARLAAERLDGIPAHGVPFTFPLDSAGLVSSGVDPPYDADRLTSWRLWLCTELARAILAADGGDALAAARSRLVALGIDPDTWQAPLDPWGTHGPG